MIFYDWGGGVKKAEGGKKRRKKAELAVVFCLGCQGRGGPPPSLPAQFGAHVTPPDQWGRAVGLTMFNVR